MFRNIAVIMLVTSCLSGTDDNFRTDSFKEWVACAPASMPGTRSVVKSRVKCALKCASATHCTIFAIEDKANKLYCYVNGYPQPCMEHNNVSIYIQVHNNDCTNCDHAMRVHIAIE